MTPRHPEFMKCPGRCGQMIRVDKAHICGETAQEEILRHLKYVCMIAERLGPGASQVHREEALFMLKGTLQEAREVIAKYAKKPGEQGGEDRT